MKFEKYEDLFSFNRCLMEDDYNDGQFLVVKDKRKAGNHEFASTIKVGENKGGKHKLAFEEKIKSKFDEFGGVDLEMKFKNNGQVAVEKKWEGIRKYNGLEHSSVLVLADIDNGALAPARIGLNFKNDKFISKTTVSAEQADPKLDFNVSYKSCSTSNIGASLAGPLKNLAGNSKLGAAYVSSLKDNSLTWGGQWSATFANKTFTNNLYQFYFHHDAGANRAGAHITYNHDEKKWASVLGLELKQADHTWKARIHDSGLLRLALQWKLHSVCKATLNTSLNLRDVPSGSVNNVPLNLSLEVKY